MNRGGASERIKPLVFCRGLLSVIESDWSTRGGASESYLESGEYFNPHNTLGVLLSQMS